MRLFMRKYERIWENMRGYEISLPPVFSAYAGNAVSGGIAAKCCQLWRTFLKSGYYQNKTN